jgi:hypothetical protein
MTTNDVWFGITAKSGVIFNKIISLVGSHDQIKWVDFQSSSSSNRIIFKAHSSPLKELTIVEALGKLQSVGICAIVAIIQDEDCDTSSVVVLVPNSETMRCDVFVVPQQDVFLEAMNKFNMTNIVGAGKNFSNNVLYNKIFLLTDVQFISNSIVTDATKKWNTIFGFGVKKIVDKANKVYDVIFLDCANLIYLTVL